MATTTKGRCYLCGAELGKTAMKNHILKVHNTEESGQDCMLLKIEGAHNKNYWLFVDIPLTSTLSTLDRFLRDIWLECCGHLSEFTAGGFDTIGKTRKISSFQPGDKLLHEYDFGDTTETLITMVCRTVRKPQKTAVRLLARNNAPEYPCSVCGKKADYICTECMWDDVNPFFCEDCAEKHEHEDMLLPVTNSPRMGQCGYTGEYDVYEYPPEGSNLPE